MNPAKETGGSGLSTVWARCVLVFVWATGVLQGLLRDDPIASNGVLSLAAFGLALLGAWTLTSPRIGRLGLPPLALLLGCVLGLLAIVLVSHTGTAIPGQEVWVLNFASYLLALSVPRGHPRVGGAAIAAFVLIIVSWGTATHRPVEELLALVTVPLTASMMGYIWYLVIGYVGRRERQAHGARMQASLAERSASEAQGVYQAGMERAAQIAMPLLSEILETRVVSEGLSFRARLAEATIRDQIRAPDLCAPALAAAIRGARERGVAVNLLGSDGAAPIPPGLAQSVAGALGSLDSGAVTLRRMPIEDHPAAVTLVWNGTDGARRRAEWRG